MKQLQIEKPILTIKKIEGSQWKFQKTYEAYVQYKLNQRQKKKL